VATVRPTAARSPTASASAWSPFRHRAFAVLWTATLVSSIGTWMHDVGAGWLMATLAPSPLMVSLVQAATTLPVFLLALPAGALADIVDRRRLLLVVQSAMATIALTLGLVVAAGRITAVALLAFTFALGACAALLAPAWQSIVPRLVPREELASAVALNSVGINVSRAIGPALGGVVIAGLGIAWPFLINAASFLAVMAAVAWWRPAAVAHRPLGAERFGSAIRAGLRYARSSSPLRATLARAAVFFVFISAYWALLPLIVRQQLGGDARLYGALVTCIGVGAVTGALLLPRVRARLGPDRLVALGTVGSAVTLLTFALGRDVVAAAAASLIAGASWIAVLSSLNVSAQMSLPDWVRARGLSVYNAVFFGSMAAGSVLWGQVADRFGIAAALVAASIGAVLGIAVVRRFHLQSGGTLDLSPSAHWPQPLVASSVDADRGPVMVTVEYRIDPGHLSRFLAALDELAAERRRNGAYAWSVYQDAAQPGRLVETFVEESWLEHLRHHERVTGADRDIQARVLAFHAGSAPPLVTHYLPPDPGA
jgi:MFS family permease/quinol monooxygenase YgiN